jgi:hypothetical protein
MASPGPHFNFETRLLSRSASALLPRAAAPSSGPAAPAMCRNVRRLPTHRDDVECIDDAHSVRTWEFYLACSQTGSRWLGAMMPSRSSATTSCRGDGRVDSGHARRCGLPANEGIPPGVGRNVASLVPVTVKARRDGVEKNKNLPW